jgi:ribosomal protein L3
MAGHMGQEATTVEGGFSFGFRQLREIRPGAEAALKVGDTINMNDVLHVGDIVNVQGVTKGKGFAGVMKRHGFHGGPRTHGQSDRMRAPGSIGNRTTPGRVFKGKRMAGHMGQEATTVKNLQVVFIDPTTNEVWVSGPVPGAMSSIVRLKVAGNQEFEGLLNVKAAEVTETVEAPVQEPTVEVTEAPEVTSEVSEK